MTGVTEDESVVVSSLKCCGLFQSVVIESDCQPSDPQAVKANVGL